MANLEKLRQYESKNAPGWGSFHIKIIEGNNPPVKYKVPVYEFPHGEVQDKFFKPSLEDERSLPIVAMRHGSKGMCTFAINRKLVKVEKVIESLLLTEPGHLVGDRHWQEVERNKKDKRYMLSGGGLAPEKKDGFNGEHVSVVGKTISGENFSAWVYYRPSK